MAVSRLRGSKVPLQITALFWVIKVLTTAMGEATSDYLVHAYNPYLAVLLGFAAFAIAMAIQLRAKSYVPWIYWLAVLMVAVFGTMAADVLHVEFHVPVHRLDDPVRRRALPGLPHLVADRAHALDPQHHDRAARALLLGRGAGDLCNGHRGR